MADELDLPWFPLHVERFTGSRIVRRMSSEHVGIYLLLLCEEWVRGPLDDKDLDLITPSEISEVREVLKKCFRSTPEGWINDTLEEVRAEQQGKAAVRSRAGKAGAQARWNKGRSGKRNATALPPQCDTNGIRVDKRRIEEIREEEEAPASGQSVDGLDAMLADFPDVAAVLDAMEHPGGKTFTYATLRTSYLFAGRDDDALADASLATLDLPERIKLVARALLEMAATGKADTWTPRLFPAYVRRLANAPDPDGDHPGMSSAEERDREAKRFEQVRSGARNHEQADMRRLKIEGAEVLASRSK